ncbi:uncharacterized protein KY384_005937 [Bacidia gigantensis]|uniref:uncharacterized protein n=1 Tax=Bacidia gigantensis TaxID=2732470 RepID=UPI001D05677D|nr:uncharacterized protein KY384_005937 [Bacidia gigantensis]KAG8529301.1 hypothetical protein KY384_005937 [Bacidia gigantensis]
MAQQVEENQTYEPKDAVQDGVRAMIFCGGAGLTASAIRTGLTRQNVGAWAVVTRSGGLIGVAIAAGATFGFTRSAAANLREKDDYVNSTIAGFLAGSLLGLQFRSLPATIGLGAGIAVSQGVLGFTGGSLTGGGQTDPEAYGGKEWYKKNRRRPIQETLEDLGEGRDTILHKGINILDEECFVKFLLFHLDVQPKKLKELSSKLQRVRKAIAPKKQFAFTSKAKEANSQKSHAETASAAGDQGSPWPGLEIETISSDSVQSKASTAGLTIASIHKCHHVQCSKISNEASASILDINSSIVDLSSVAYEHSSLSNLMISNVKNSLLDSSSPEEQNLWDQIDDFKWLRAGQSPNWTTLVPDDQRGVPMGNWPKVLDQKANVEDILRAANIDDRESQHSKADVHSFDA